MADQMTIDRAVVQQALEALEYMHKEKCDYMRRNNLGDPLREDAARLALPAINALTTALAQAEPVQSAAWVDAYDMIDRFLRNNLRDDDYAEYSAALDSLYTAPQQAEPVAEPFVVRHYIYDDRPIIKGNGFDGLVVGDDREEADQFVAWVNARIAAPPKRKPLTEEEIHSIAAQVARQDGKWIFLFTRAVERAHGIGKESGDER